MAVLVRPLTNFRTQLNAECPNRRRDSDGWVGDYAHSQSKSSHNPDDTGQGNAEWDGDSDTTQEVRAIDVDKDLMHPAIDMDEFIEWFIGRCRAGEFWWVRYVIYKGRIWHKRDGYVTRVYTGSNQHNEHAHINTDFSQSADNADPDYRMERIFDDMSAADVNAINSHTNAQIAALKAELLSQLPREIRWEAFEWPSNSMSWNNLAWLLFNRTAYMIETALPAIMAALEANNKAIAAVRAVLEADEATDVVALQTTLNELTATESRLRQAIEAQPSEEPIPEPANP